MKKYKLQKLLFVHFTLFATGFCGLSWSHDLAGALGVPFYSTDVYQVRCTTDSGGVPYSLEFRILDPTPVAGGGKLNVVVAAAGYFTQTGDQVRGDAGWSPLYWVYAGSGPYQMIVHKLFAGSKVYALEYHCKSSSGAHTGTSEITIQDQ